MRITPQLPKKRERRDEHQMETKPVAVRDGAVARMRDATVPSYLERGPCAGGDFGAAAALSVQCDQARRGSRTRPNTAWRHPAHCGSDLHLREHSRDDLRAGQDRKSTRLNSSHLV